MPEVHQVSWLPRGSGAGMKVKTPNSIALAGVLGVSLWTRIFRIGRHYTAVYYVAQPFMQHNSTIHFHGSPPEARSTWTPAGGSPSQKPAIAPPLETGGRRQNRFYVDVQQVGYAKENPMRTIAGNVSMQYFGLVPWPMWKDIH